MGNNSKEGKSEKLASPAASDQTNAHVYHDWAAMQAYYGPRVALPAYYNSVLPAGHHPPPYIWGSPQPMMPPYGTPYAAIYSPGGVYPHPTTLAAASCGAESPNIDNSLMKKLKTFDGLAMSIGNGNGKNADTGSHHRLSHSTETGGSSEGTDSSINKVDQTRRRRSCNEAQGSNGKIETQASTVTPVHAGEMKSTSDKVLGATVDEKSVGPALSGTTTSLKPNNCTKLNTETIGLENVSQLAVLPPEPWLQDERELKQERRKQSNRESARRSRLRRQAEAEELAHKVELLTAENTTLKLELDQLRGKTENLSIHNAALMDTLKNTQHGKIRRPNSGNFDNTRDVLVSTKNLLSGIECSDSIQRRPKKEGVGQTSE